MNPWRLFQSLYISFFKSTSVVLASCACATNQQSSLSPTYPLCPSPLTEEWLTCLGCFAGPATRTVTEPLPVGRFVTYTLTGVDLPTDNALLVLPARDIGTQRASKCGHVDEDEQVFPSKAQTEPGVTDRVTFKDLIISTATHRVLVCWCGGDNCSSGVMYRTQIGEMPVQCK